MHSRRLSPGPSRNRAFVLALLLGLSRSADLVAAPVNPDASSLPSVADLAVQLRTALPSLPAPPADLTNAVSYLQSLAPLVLCEHDEPPETPLVAKTAVYSDQVGYVRIGQVAPGLRQALDASLEALARSNALAGVVLDLRFAGGSDYGASAEAAGALGQRPIEAFRLGSTTWKVEPAAAPRALPVVVLVNRRTRRAAEALAAAVRAATSPSLLLGTNTAGEARTYRPLRLAPEIDVQVAGEGLVLADGSTFPSGGLEPDLSIAVPEADERTYLTNEFLWVRNARSVAPHPTFRLNEAELVRRRRGPEAPAEAPVSPEPSVKDPVLGRAIDLLAGRAAEMAAGDSGDSR